MFWSLFSVIYFILYCAVSSPYIFGSVSFKSFLDLILTWLIDLLYVNRPDKSLVSVSFQRNKFWSHCSLFSCRILNAKISVSWYDGRKWLTASWDDHDQWPVWKFNSHFNLMYELGPETPACLQCVDNFLLSDLLFPTEPKRNMFVRFLILSSYLIQWYLKHNDHNLCRYSPSL